MNLQPTDVKLLCTEFCAFVWHVKYMEIICDKILE